MMPNQEYLDSIRRKLDSMNKVAGVDPTKAIPVGRFGEHDEFADACAFLVSDSAGYINGDMMTIDGGRGLKGMDVDDLFEWSNEQWDALKSGRKR
jgi:NAD(P)-dependent dehydrogenase (short-subunit alcohol dehydrogenase family)